jgi:predicted DNA binding CopG/RHH family protein
MRKKTINHDMPIGKLTRVADFLPSPEKLAVTDDTVKVTISLKKSSIEFFKNAARRYHTKYQKMIRELVDKYATQYS